MFRSSLGQRKRVNDGQPDGFSLKPEKASRAWMTQ
ncbi:hypothetical protein A2U01_0065354, partial [Trifolium medium]|nr:hypothetical protein [Trifolium medium]